MVCGIRIGIRLPISRELSLRTAAIARYVILFVVDGNCPDSIEFLVVAASASEVDGLQPRCV